MNGENMDKQTVIGFVVLFCVLELVFYLKKLYQSMALTLAVFGIFSLLFFLLYIPVLSKKAVPYVINYFKPPHQRVREIKVGSDETTDNSIIRLKEKAKTLHPDEGNRISGRSSNSFKDSASCIITIVDDSN